jgi:hypothetical protein
MIYFTIKWWYLDIRSCRNLPTLFWNMCLFLCSLSFTSCRTDYSALVRVRLEHIILNHAADNKTRLVFARDIQFDLQYWTLDQVSMCSHWSGLLSFGVSTTLVKVKTTSNIYYSHDGKYINSCLLICDDVYSSRWMSIFLEICCFCQQARKMLIPSRSSRKRPFWACWCLSSGHVAS